MEKLAQTQAELEKYGTGPPSDAAERLIFLIDVSSIPLPKTLQMLTININICLIINKVPVSAVICVFQKITTFSQDAISLTTGEELKFGERLNVFSMLRKEFGKWNDHLDRSGENCECTMLVRSRADHQQGSEICICVAVNKRIEREVAEHEERYRGRELPGFINYKTFEVMVKEQIKQLEEPAVKKLKDISGIW